MRRLKRTDNNNALPNSKKQKHWSSSLMLKAQSEYSTMLSMDQKCSSGLLRNIVPGQNVNWGTGKNCAALNSQNWPQSERLTFVWRYELSETCRHFNMKAALIEELEDSFILKLTVSRIRITNFWKKILTPGKCDFSWIQSLYRFMIKISLRSKRTSPA